MQAVLKTESIGIHHKMENERIYQTAFSDFRDFVNFEKWKELPTKHIIFNFPNEVSEFSKKGKHVKVRECRNRQLDILKIGRVLLILRSKMTTFRAFFLGLLYFPYFQICSNLVSSKTVIWPLSRC